MGKYVLTMEELMSDGTRFTFNLGRFQSATLSPINGVDILSAKIYPNVRDAQLEVTSSGAKGKFKIVPYHWGLRIGIQQALSSELRHELKLLHVLEVPPKCIGCGKVPEEIEEYAIVEDEDDGMTPSQYVVEYEGTYDRFEPNRFYCTTCYIDAGMPDIPGGR